MSVPEIQAGQRVQVTSLLAVRGWRGHVLVTVPAGAQVTGTVADLTIDGFFELHSDSGELHSFSANDHSISIQPVATTACQAPSLSAQRAAPSRRRGMHNC